jgi:Tol biopolymer transport system component
MRNKFFPIILLLMSILSTPVRGASETEYLVFSQVINGLQVIHSYQPDTQALNRVVQGKNLSVFLQGKYFLYFKEQKLFQYNIVTQQAKELATFKEKELYLEVIPDGPEQALVVAKDGYDLNWYVLELSDGSFRRVMQPPTGRGRSTTPKLISPDKKATAVIKTPAFSQNFTLSIEENVNGRKKTSWSLSRDMTIIPDWPIWSPDSKQIAFYAKKADGFEGFYSLYLLDLAKKDLILVENQVFAKYIFSNIGMKSFIPAWSEDSQFLIFQCQPNGLPNSSLIVKYHVPTGKKQILTQSAGSNDYPNWSLTNRYISFLSNRETSKRQLFIMDPQGANVRRVSPQEGFTEWAEWYRPN